VGEVEHQVCHRDDPPVGLKCCAQRALGGVAGDKRLPILRGTPAAHVQRRCRQETSRSREADQVAARASVGARQRRRMASTRDETRSGLPVVLVLCNCRVSRRPESPASVYISASPPTTSPGAAPWGPLGAPCCNRPPSHLKEKEQAFTVSTPAALPTAVRRSVPGLVGPAPAGYGSQLSSNSKSCRGFSTPPLSCRPHVPRRCPARV
jgi:hypothetical protein